MATQLSKIFSNNRAEVFPDDLWNKFVLPIDYEQYNLHNFDQGVRVVGGRGTGKTMFLKYHCYETQFSTNRKEISLDNIEKIGIYWKPDTHFSKLININYLKSEEKVYSVFNTYIGLSLVVEVLKFFKVFINSNFKDEETKNRISNLEVPKVILEELNYIESEDIKFINFHEHCNGLLYKLSNWLNNPFGKEIPINLDGRTTLQYIINTLYENNILKNKVFHIFIDEFENLLESHQKLVNSWMKHNQKPLIFSTAHKKYAVVSQKTVGLETFQPIHDYRVIDIIEDVYAKGKNSFQMLSAEIIISKIQQVYPDLGIIDYSIISDSEKLEIRKDKNYQKTILDFINGIFPELTLKELAEEILNDNSLKNKLLNNIKLALKKSELSPELFINDKFPDASVVNSVLLPRRNKNPDEILKAFNSYMKDTNSQPKYKELINNNIVGAILLIYTSFSKRVCPIYAGFNKFCLMARNNLRHLLELCHHSFLTVELNSVLNINDIKIPVNIQAQSAKTYSKLELEKILELGNYGSDLQKIANRLGKIFSLRQRMKTQSEPEIIHFSVDTLDLKTVDKDIQTLINEAKIWNVLLEYDSTKEYIDDVAIKEYMLTPVLAPYFKVTPRKIRKMKFSLLDLKTIFLDSDEKFDILYQEFTKKFKIDDNEKEDENQVLNQKIFDF